MRSFVALVASFAVAAGAPAPAVADNAYGRNETVVAVLDTGLRPTHQEFDYGGPASTTDQIVAWWDFTSRSAALPEPGQTWDPRHPDPIDPHGHGTAVASLTVGRNRAGQPTKDPSFAPGAKLAVGRVCGNPECTGDLAAAIAWATDTVHADVITISIGHIVPGMPTYINGVYDAVRRARAAGVLVVFANGNGVHSGPIPAPGWATSYSNVPDALSVGAADVYGLVVTQDPEVVAKAVSAAVASVQCDTCYTRMGGTSFSAPLVAGMAAAAMGTARAHRRDASPQRIETLLKHVAIDDAVLPPWVDGYGRLDATTVPALVAHAAAGTAPTRPSPDLSGIYVEHGAGTLRDLWSNGLGADLKSFVPTPLPVTVFPGPGRLGTGSYAGLAEGEIHQVTLSRGERATLSAPSVDLYVFEGGDLVLQGRERVGTAPAAARGPVSWRSPAGGTYTVLVMAPLVVTPRAYTLTATSTDPRTATPRYVGEYVYAFGQTAVDRVL